MMMTAWRRAMASNYPSNQFPPSSEPRGPRLENHTAKDEEDDDNSDVEPDDNSDLVEDGVDEADDENY